MNCTQSVLVDFAKKNCENYTRGFMKKFLGILVLGLMFYNITLAQSSLTECEGNDKNISEFSGKHFLMIRKWTNCHGTAIGPKGGKYVGEFYKGKFHGQGIYTKAGRKYVGQYKNHKRQGQGTYTYANGDKYVGGWTKHKYDGTGIYTYANGDKYVGEWKKSLRHGKGTFTHANGKIEKGIWKKDKLVK